MKSHRRGFVAFAAILLLATTGVVINQSAVHWRSDIADDQLFAYFGWLTSSGARPYVDFWDNKPPGVFWINALAIGIAGPGVSSEILLGAFAGITTILLIVGVAQLVFARGIALIAAAAATVVLTDLRFECGGNRTETYLVVAELLTIFAYLRWLRGGRARWLFIAGLAAGIAPHFKQSGLAAAAACLIHFAFSALRAHWSSRSKSAVLTPPFSTPTASGRLGWLAALLGFSLPIAMSGATLAIQGSLGEAWFAVAQFNRAYFAVDDATWFRIDRAVRVFWPALRPLWPLAFLTLAGLATRICGPRARITLSDDANRPCPRPGYALLWLWFLLAAYLACVGPGRRGYHFMPALPPLTLLALQPLHAMLAGRRLRAALVARPAAAAMVLVYVATLGNLYSGSLAEAARSWSLKPTWAALGYRTPPEFAQVAAALRRSTFPEDTIYVWGWNPGAYRYSWRWPASRFATFEKLGQVGPHAQFIFDGALLDIRKRPPAAIAISTADLTGLAAPATEEFGRWLRASYLDLGVTGGMHILVFKSTD